MCGSVANVDPDVESKSIGAPSQQNDESRMKRYEAVFRYGAEEKDQYELLDTLYALHKDLSETPSSNKMKLFARD